MTWFKKRQPRLPLLIGGALIPDRAFSLFLIFKPGQDSIHLECCFFRKYMGGSHRVAYLPFLWRSSATKIISGESSRIGVRSKFPYSAVTRNPHRARRCSIS